MSSRFAIRVADLSKCYQIYAQPQDRLKQMVYPRLARLIGRRHRAYHTDFWALRDINLEIGIGETFGVVGRNGSGKSTLLQLVAGTLTPTNGVVETAGRVAAILELGSGFNFEFTGRENVYVSAGLHGLSKAQIEERMESITAFADIGDFIDQPVKTYSSGMVVRLAFAVIAHVDADILIIDEALAVGDAFFTQKCMRFLRDFKRRGTIFFVSHDTQAVQGLCDRAALLEGGRLKLVADAKTVSETYLENLYGQQQKVSRLAGDAPAPAGPASAIDDDGDVRGPALAAGGELAIFRFDPSSAGFGTGGVRIRDVVLNDPDGRRLAQVAGGERVVLEIVVDAIVALRRPIAGFYVKDRLGQYLFGDNTFLTYLGSPPAVPAGATFRARFEFTMPRLPAGDYFIAPAIADGTQEDHVQHQWIHEALMFRSNSSSGVSGLIGIPMRRIELAVVAAEGAAR